jgi:hypothetical protein
VRGVLSKLPSDNQKKVSHLGVITLCGLACLIVSTFGMNGCKEKRLDVPRQMLCIVLVISVQHYQLDWEFSLQDW